MEPKVSVIIPVYNTAPYLRDCIESLLAQTLAEIELLFIDDASTDESLSILQEYEKKDPKKIHVFASEKNLRQGGARNMGLRAAKGTYIGFCDSDDLVAPEMFETLYHAITEHQVDAAFCDIAPVPLDASCRDVAERAILPTHEVWSKRLGELSDRPLTDADRMELLICPVDATVTWMYSRAYLLEHELFFPEQVRFEDNYWAPLTKAALNSVHFVDQVYYYYRTNPESTTKSRNNPAVYDRKKLENALVEELRRRGYYERLLPAIEYLYTTRYAFMTYGFFLYTFDQVPKKELRALMRELRAHFPRWAKNSLYLRETSKKARLLNQFRYHFPLLFASLRTFGSQSR